MNENNVKINSNNTLVLRSEMARVIQKEKLFN